MAPKPSAVLIRSIHLLGCDTVSLGQRSPTFLRTLMLYLLRAKGSKNLLQLSDESQVAGRLKFRTMANNICGSSVWNMFHITLLLLLLLLLLALLLLQLLLFLLFILFLPLLLVLLLLLALLFLLLFLPLLPFSHPPTPLLLPSPSRTPTSLPPNSSPYPTSTLLLALLFLLLFLLLLPSSTSFPSPSRPPPTSLPPTSSPPPTSPPPHQPKRYNPLSTLASNTIFLHSRHSLATA